MVGAVVVKDGRIVGKGYHQRAGEDHAEVIALREAGNQAKSGTLYTNLEPCVHTGRTSPCTEIILKSEISKVVAGIKDPNPQVSGKGFGRLKDAGIEVEEGVLEEKASQINEAYLKYIQTRIPYVILKIAASLDGKIAQSNSTSKWITGEESRKRVHEWRNRVDAILVGVWTVIQDNPSLTVRNVERIKNPIRIILDSTLRIPKEARILNGDEPTIIATTEKASRQEIEELEKRGIKVWILKANKKGQVDIEDLLSEAGKREILSIFVEGGSEIFTAFLPYGDKLLYFIAPKIFGEGTPAIGNLNSSLGSLSLTEHQWEQIGDDLLLEGYLKK
jgi:diaminohydroxyphosphoribosylaminopyrimidine deaminase/5-amino-6-(5-phosphoribosylamino)uracil reductase